MGNAGEARLDVVAMANDEVTVVMNKIAAELDAMKAKLAGYERAQKGTAQAASEAAKSTRSAASEIRTLGEHAGVSAPEIAKIATVTEEATKKFSTMHTAIVGGVIGGLASGVIGAIGSLIGELGTLVVSFLSTEERLDSLSESLIASANDAAKMASKVTDIGSAAYTAAKQVEGFGAKVATLAATIADVRGQTELAAEFRKMAQVAATGDVIKAAEQNMQAAEAAANDAGAVLKKMKPQLEAAQLEVASLQEMIKYREGLGLDTSTQRTQLGLATLAMGNLRIEVARTEDAYRKSADAVSKMAEELALLDSLEAEIEAQPPGGAPGTEQVTRTPRGVGRRDAGVVTPPIPQNDFLFGASSGGPDEDFDYTAPMTQTEEFEKRIRRLTDSIGELGRAIGVASPELGAMFAGIAESWAGVENNAKSMAGGVLGSVDAILNASAKWFKTEKEQTRFLAAKEALLAIPLWFIDPAQAAAKTAASIGLFALAGGGGGGGSRGGGGGATSAGGTSGGGNGGTGVVVNNIHNYQMGFGDQQTMISAQRQGERRARGTGNNAGVGV